MITLNLTLPEWVAWVLVFILVMEVANTIVSIANLILRRKIEKLDKIIKDDLLVACKMVLGAFENNNAIDWSILENAIVRAERTR